MHSPSKGSPTPTLKAVLIHDLALYYKMEEANQAWLNQKTVAELKFLHRKAYNKIPHPACPITGLSKMSKPELQAVIRQHDLIPTGKGTIGEMQFLLRSHWEVQCEIGKQENKTQAAPVKQQGKEAERKRFSREAEWEVIPPSDAVCQEVPTFSATTPALEQKQRLPTMTPTMAPTMTPTMTQGRGYISSVLILEPQ